MQASLKDLASRLQLEGKNSLSSPLKQLDEAKLWMSEPVIAGAAQMPRSNATTKAALSCQSTSSTIPKKTSKCDSAWIRIWRQSRNCNQLRTLKSRLRKVTVCRGLFSAVAEIHCWVPRKQRALPGLQNAWWAWTVKQPLSQQQHGQHCSVISSAQTASQTQASYTLQNKISLS